MKVRGDFLGPPRSTDKTTLIGIFLTNMEFKFFLFADDASFILDGSFKSFQK